jgi:lysyl-tRNA synthetase class 1
MSDIYPTGDVDPFIRTALDRAATVREIYRRVANVQHPDHWLPVSVICPNCGKVGTTISSDWDGQTVAVACQPDLVEWATGCGWSGRVSPFGGNAKLPWNLEWAAQWRLFGVTIEPNGKDLATAGGSRDRSEAIAREVFEFEPPLNFPYEFLNIAGKKMSTSKGRGAAAHTFTEIVPPEQTRFLFTRPRPESAIDFDPEGTDAVPRLFDEFDRLGAATAGREVKGEVPSGFASIFRYALLDPDADIERAAGAFRPAFAHLALLVQVPGVDVAARVAAEKGAPLTDEEAAEFDVRLAAVRRWLEAYAPERARIEVRRDALPVEVDQLRPEQRGFLRSLAEAAHGDAPATGEQWQAAIFAVAADHALDAKAAFNALYLAFLGRPNGPRAGWLLASLERDFVIGRLKAAGEHGEAMA